MRGWPILILALLTVACQDDTSGTADALVPDATADVDTGSDGRDDGSPPDGDAEPVETADSVAPEPTWSTLPDVEPGPIQENAVVALDRKIYVIGGFDAGEQELADVRVYDVDTASWTQAAPLPRPLHHANAAVVNGKIYVLGALEGFFIETPDAFVYDPATDAWSPVESMPDAEARGSSAMGVVDGKVYAAGGFRQLGATSIASRYDVAGDTWETLPPIPGPRDHGVGAVVNGRFFVVGGREGSVFTVRPDVWEWDEAGQQWVERAPMPVPRGGTAGAVVGGRIVVIGGEGNQAVGADGVFDAVAMFDPSTDTWSDLPPMLTPRHGTGAAAVDAKIYVPGGATVAAFGAVATFEVLDLGGLD